MRWATRNNWLWYTFQVILQLRKYTNTQTHKYTNTQIHKHTSTQTHKHTNTQTHKYTNTQIHKHIKFQSSIRFEHLVQYFMSRQFWFCNPQQITDFPPWIAAVHLHVVFSQINTDLSTVHREYRFGVSTENTDLRYLRQHSKNAFNVLWGGFKYSNSKFDEVKTPGK